MKILVIDDNLTAREAISNFLNGHDIVKARSLQEGIAGLELNPQLVIADWNLGNEVDSTDIINLCLEKGIRVVIQTASPYVDSLDEMRGRGVEIVHKLDLLGEIKGNLENMGKSSVER